MAENEQQEGVDVDALDKTLEKLTKAFEKLNDSILDMARTTKTNNKGSKVDHDKIHKQNMERQNQYFANVKAMKLLSKEMKGSQDSFSMFTGLLTKGVTLGTVFKKITKHVDGYISASDRLRDSTQHLAELEESVAKKQGVDKVEDIDWTKAGTDRNTRTDLLDTQSKAKEQGGESGLGGKLSGAKEFFGKHKMGMMIGAGSAGVLIGIFKKALDVSPMFQAIKKLLNFGIMMVLRPIGDFVGFLLRPIMVWMLRKLIIPFYTTFLPLAQQWGTDIGNLVTGFFDFVLSWGNITDKKTKEITGSFSANSAISAVEDMDGNMIDSTDKLGDLVAKSLALNTKAYLDSTKDAGTMGDWQSKEFELFGENQGINKVSGYDVEGVGKNLPLAQAAVDWYKQMGAVVTATEGYSNYERNFGSSPVTDIQYSQMGATTQSIQNMDNVMKERELTLMEKDQARMDAQLAAAKKNDVSNAGVVVNVQGSVLSENDLGKVIQDALEDFQKRIGSMWG